MGHSQFTRRYVVLTGLHVGAKLFGFAASVAVARHYGAIGFGLLNLAQSITRQGSVAATCGLDVYAVRDVAAHQESVGTIAGTVVFLRSLLAIVAYGSLLCIAAFVAPFRPIIGLVAVFGLQIFIDAASLLWVSRAVQRTHVFGLAQFAAQAIYCGLVLICMYATLSLWSVPVAVISAEAVVAIGLWIWMLGSVGRVGRPLPLGSSVRFLMQAAPIGGSRVLRSVSIASDVMLLGVFLTMAEVGSYSAAFKLYLAGVSLVMVYVVLLLPHLSRHAAQSLESLSGELRSSLCRTLPLAAVGLGGAILFAKPLLKSVFGASFVEARASLQILLLALLVYLANAQLRNALIVLNQQRRDLGNVLAGTVAHFGSKVVLIPMIGIAGAAWGTLVGETVLLGLSLQATYAALRASRAQEIPRSDELETVGLPG